MTMSAIPEEVHHGHIAKNLYNRFGGENLTSRYNIWRILNGQGTVKPATVYRYCNGGKGYENGPPPDFKEFAANLALRMLSTA